MRKPLNVNADAWYRAARDREKAGGGRAGVFRITTIYEHAAGERAADRQAAPKDKNKFYG